ncbi:thioredoxin [Actinomycetaceae bacterium TAE3-ERU4]|nr:thioredoxin [Actinomycetaceae bacterium TAE3-ERU4]
MSDVLTVTDRDFQANIRLDKGLMVVDFWAPWCGPCKKLSPILEKVAKDLSGKAKVWKLNVQDNPTTAAKYGVRTIPTIMVFFDGDLVETMVGLTTKEEIVKTVSKYILS